MAIYDPNSNQHSDGSDSEASFFPKKKHHKELFTQGDWEVDNPKMSEYTVATKDMTIAAVYAIDISDEEAEANAALISQAPAMYRALKDLIDGKESGMGKSAMQLRFELAKDILKKANPQQS